LVGSAGDVYNVDEGIGVPKVIEEFVA